MTPDADLADEVLDRIDVLLRRARAGENVQSDVALLPEPARRDTLAALDAERSLTGRVDGTDAKGARFGPFELVRELGRGGQGVVHLATDTRLSRAVALKVLDAASPARLARFRREAEIASRLDHRGICSVLDVGEANGRAYIAMRYVEGSTLSRASLGDPRTPAGVRRAAEIVEECARALHLAHESGIVHRDVKPGNVIIGRDGLPVILDFGLAGVDGSDTGLTATGRPIGTPAYMSPEQIEAGARGGVDRRSDVFSLGAILFELLTGKRPFEAPTREALYRAILSDAPKDPRSENPAVPRDLAIVAATALEKDRDRRYRTALDLAEDLRRVRERRPILARKASALLRARRWSERHAVPAAAIVTAFLALAGGLAVSLAALRESRVARDAAERALESERASNRLREGLHLVGLARDLASRSPGLALVVGLDGARLAPGAAANNALLRVLQQNHEERLFAGGGGSAEAAAFDPDARAVAVAWEDGTVRLFDAASGDTRWTFRCDGGARSLAFSPDGLRLAIGGRDGTALVLDARDGNRLESIAIRRGDVFSLDFDPDGRRLATAHGDGSALIHSLRDAPAAPPIALAGHAAAVLCLRFDPTGSFLVTASRDGDARLFDASDGRPIGTLRHGEGDVISGVDVSRSGALIATASSDNTVWLWDVATLSPRCRVYGHGSAVNSVRFDGSGERFVTTSWDRTVRVFSAIDGREQFVLRGHEDETLCAEFSLARDAVVSASADGSARLWRLTSRPGVALFDGGGAPIRSAGFDSNGSRVLTVADDGTVRVFDAASARLLRERRDPDSRAAWGRFMPDGASILTGTRDGGVRLETPRLGARRFESGGTGVPAGVTNADGSLLFTLATGGEARLHDVATGEIHRRLRAVPPVFENAPASTAAFSPDGRLLAFLEPGGAAVVTDAATGEVVRRFASPGGEPRSLAFSPEGRRIATAGPDGAIRVHALGGGATIECAGHASPAAQATFSSDGERVISCGHDKTARLFDARNGREIAVLRGHESLLYSAVFDPAGERVVTASWDGTARVFDARTGAEILAQEAHTEPVMVALFSPDGKSVLSASRDGAARLFPADPVECATRWPRRELTAAERARVPALEAPAAPARKQRD